MTSLDPSHNVFRKSSGRHAQAVYNAQDAPSPADDDISEDENEDDLGVDDHVKARQRGRKEGRKRVRAAMPPLPDQRFEQSYLLSIRPFLTPKPSATSRATSTERDQQTRSKIVSAEDDAVFQWGRDVEVDWKMVSYVTLRDQLFWPMISGALWGWGSLFLASTSSALRGSLYPPSHVRKGRVTGGPGGKLEQAGAGEAVGGSWWRKFVKSWGGAVQTAAL